MRGGIVWAKATRKTRQEAIDAAKCEYAAPDPQGTQQIETDKKLVVYVMQNGHIASCGCGETLDRAIEATEHGNYCQVNDCIMLGCFSVKEQHDE